MNNMAEKVRVLSQLCVCNYANLVINRLVTSKIVEVESTRSHVVIPRAINNISLQCGVSNINTRIHDNVINYYFHLKMFNYSLQSP